MFAPFKLRTRSYPVNIVNIVNIVDIVDIVVDVCSFQAEDSVLSCQYDGKTHLLCAHSVPDTDAVKKLLKKIA